MLKPQKVIEQNGDSFTIHTNSTFRNYVVKFKVGEEFDEDNKGVDNRKCKVKIIYLVLAVLGLCCHVGCFLWLWRSWLLSSCSAKRSHCGGFSCCRAQVLRHVGSVVVALSL